ncbi:MAG: FecR domain-containing protein [Cyanobacteria bacterium P01_D01_bin.156]
MAQAQRLNRRTFGMLMVATTFGVIFKSRLAAATDYDYSVRWLRIKRVSGSVTMLNGQRKSASVGDYLLSEGEGLVTGRRSTAHLEVDDGIASVAVAQNTEMTIQQLSLQSDGSRVTILDVPRGQARFQVRRFTHSNSRLELRTPSGVAAVRGTNFGVLVNQQGQTNVATLEGQVDVSAQGVSMPVTSGTASIIYPGEAPTAVRSVDRELDIRWEDYEWRGESFYMAGYVDAANVIRVNDQEVTVDRAGYFEQIVVFDRKRQVVSIIVQNPMGETRTHRVFPRGEG